MVTTRVTGVDARYRTRLGKSNEGRATTRRTWDGPRRGEGGGRRGAWPRGDEAKRAPATKARDKHRVPRPLQTAIAERATWW